MRWLLCFWLLCCSGFVTADKAVLRIGMVDMDGFPLIMGDGPDLQTPPGIGPDLLLAAAAESGITIEIVRMPTKRLHRALKDGLLDAFGFISFKAERQDYAVYPPLHDGAAEDYQGFSLSYHFYALQNSPYEWDGRQLKHFSGTVGANLGYSVVADLKRLKLTVLEDQSTEKLLSLLEMQRIQAFAGQSVSTEPYLRGRGGAEIIRLDPAIKTKAYYLVFSQQFYQAYPQQALRFWQALRMVREKVLRTYADIQY